eukprot:5912097-Amphidinium_carterae.1
MCDIKRLPDEDGCESSNNAGRRRPSTIPWLQEAAVLATLSPLRSVQERSVDTAAVPQPRPKDSKSHCVEATPASHSRSHRVVIADLLNQNVFLK